MERNPAHRLQATMVAVLLYIFVVPACLSGQQPFVHPNDIRFSVGPERRAYFIGDAIVVNYVIKNVSNGALYVPAGQWDIRCGNPPHLWIALEDHSGKHYEPGWATSCGSPNPVERMSVSERMQKDALLLRPGQAVAGSIGFNTRVFATALKPGSYRLEGMLYGWNVRFDDSQLSELVKMGAPFLVGESSASSSIQFRAGP